MTILNLIGNTPCVKLEQIFPGLNIYGKLEGFNPTGSIKDRIALKMIEDAETSGKLARGKTIIEATSGNTGIALAMVGVVKGYDVIVVMSKAVSVERRKMIKAYGAQIILTPADEGTDGAIKKCREIIKADIGKYYCPDQYSNPSNFLAHAKTGQEIIDQIGMPDYIVCGIGTSGTIMGLSKFFHKQIGCVNSADKTSNEEISNKVTSNMKISNKVTSNMKISNKEKTDNRGNCIKFPKIIGAHPGLGHKIQGLKNLREAIVPEIFDKKLVDEIINVDDDASFACARDIALREGILVGMSSGAAICASKQRIHEIRDKKTCIIFPDRGEKYLSTELFD